MTNGNNYYQVGGYTIIYEQQVMSMASSGCVCVHEWHVYSTSDSDLLHTYKLATTCTLSPVALRTLPDGGSPGGWGSVEVMNNKR